MDDSAELVSVWNRARPRFDDPSIRPQQKAWIGLTRPLGLVEDTALLAAPNDFAKDYLENRLRPLIASVLSEELGREIRVAVTVQSPESYDPSDGADADLVDEDDWDADQPLVVAPPSHYRPKHSDDERETRLNPKYTFDTFVIGSSNRFAHAAAVAVAEAPAKAYNPLFIYGDSGLGKTHLLHAIGHYAMSLYPGIRVRYVSSEEFTNDFINSIANNRGSSFQARYRNIDILLIDDIQFLQRAVET
ncbi:MAG TPA: DnaA/Hda family protein, partial [Jatrophihabitans sp.]|nr:DnaA/Hda family protein [Jatrophihabitans sp.]